MKRWRANPTEENFWGVVVSYAGVGFKTYSGLLFSYEVRKGRNGEYTKELWIDRRENSKSLAWSSVLLALKNIKGEVVDRPKALGDIRGVTYIYGMGSDLLAHIHGNDRLDHDRLGGHLAVLDALAANIIQ